VHRTLATILALLPLLACGTDTIASPPPDLTGSWNYTVENLTGEVLQGGSCSFTGITLHLTQSDQAFTGTYSSGSESCTLNGQPHTLVIDAGFITDGTVSDDQVGFTIGAVRNSGTIAAAKMSGTVSGTVTLNGNTGTVTGNWSAVRQ
jgi:hypothetical protein